MPTASERSERANVKKLFSPRSGDFRASGIRTPPKAAA
jgi:hypothetical protein